MSRRLNVLETAGLVTSDKRGQFVRYALVPGALATTLNGFVQDVGPVSKRLKRESAAVRRSEG